jgi:ABC-type sugar transport system ATPase subunit
LSIAGARKTFGAHVVFDGLDLSVAHGEFLVLVGPSGCGKSTLLRLVAGLDTLDAGEIAIGDERIDHLPPSERGTAMVFQSYALYPRMTVAQNIGFPLRMGRMPRGEIARRVADAAALLGLDRLLDRRPAELSGGQRQRVAIGRAIVREPSLFLFDEPLSNLDAGLRASMRREFAELHRRFGITTIYVTHDQSEAMALADRIALMRDGRIVQVGTPRELYCDPDDLFAAEFFGAPAINLLAGVIGEVGEERIRLELDGASWSVHAPRSGKLAPGMPLTVGIRPEAIEACESSHALSLPVKKIRLVEWFGGERQVVCEGPAGDIVWRTSREIEPAPGEAISLWADPARLLLFDSNGARLR